MVKLIEDIERLNFLSIDNQNNFIRYRLYKGFLGILDNHQPWN